MPSQSKCTIFSFDVDVIGYYPRGYVHFCFIFLSLVYLDTQKCGGGISLFIRMAEWACRPKHWCWYWQNLSFKSITKSGWLFSPSVSACLHMYMHAQGWHTSLQVTYIFFFKHWIVIFEGEGFLCSSYMQHFILVVVPDCVCVLIVCWVQFSVATELSPWDELQVSQCRWMWPRDTDFWVCAWTYWLNL